MSDSGGGVKQITQEFIQDAGEVVQDVKDEVGQMIEANVQTAVGSQLTPQQQQQKQQEEQEGLVKARKVIDYYKNLGTDIKKAEEERKQKDLQRKQQMEQEDQAKKVQKVQQQQTQKESIREDLARTQMERSKGRGVGG